MLKLINWTAIGLLLFFEFFNLKMRTQMTLRLLNILNRIHCSIIDNSSFLYLLYKLQIIVRYFPAVVKKNPTWIVLLCLLGASR
jgi:hypothetical protein